MKQKSNIKHILFPIVIMLFFCIVVILQAQFIPGSDDEFYSTALKNKEYDILAINNRVLVNLIAVFIEYGGILFWKICNLIICTLMFLYLIKIVLLLTGQPANFNTNVIFLGLIFFIPVNVLSSGLFWATGSFSYLWGLVGCLMYIYPFLCLACEKPCFTKEFIFALAGGIYAGNLEQSSSVQVIFVSIILGYLLIKRKKNVITMKYWLLFLLSWLSLIILLLLPFNRIRASAATIYYPDFDMLSFTDKLFQGFINLYSHLVYKDGIIMCILTGLIFFHIINKRNHILINILSLVPFLYFICNLLIKADIFLGNTIPFLYNFDKFRYEDIKNFSEFIPFIFMTFILIIEAYLLVLIFQNTFTKLCAFLIYGASISSALMLSFSPTIFVSGNRVFFMLNLFILLLIGMLLYENKNNKNLIVESYVCFGIMILDFVLCIVYNLMFKGRILY